jgi:hypothetical protein
MVIILSICFIGLSFKDIYPFTFLPEWIYYPPTVGLYISIKSFGTTGIRFPRPSVLPISVERSQPTIKRVTTMMPGVRGRLHRYQCKVQMKNAMFTHAYALVCHELHTTMTTNAAEACSVHKFVMRVPESYNVRAVIHCTLMAGTSYMHWILYCSPLAHTAECAAVQR